MSGAIPLLPQYAFKASCLVKKHRDNFTFTFLVSNDLLAIVVSLRNCGHDMCTRSVLHSGHDCHAQSCAVFLSTVIFSGGSDYSAMSKEQISLSP
jgi:hypothetical protein